MKAVCLYQLEVTCPPGARFPGTRPEGRSIDRLSASRLQGEQDEVTHGTGKRPPCRQRGGVYFIEVRLPHGSVCLTVCPRTHLPYSVEVASSRVITVILGIGRARSAGTGTGLRSRSTTGDVE